MIETDLGLGPKYTTLRPIQTEILDRLVADQPRVAFVEAPVGIGKSALAVQWGAEVGRDILPEHVIDQTTVLTATISLQEQYAADFYGMALVKGRGNFDCTDNELSAAEGTCTMNRGFECDSEYYDMRANAKMSDRVVANYAVYLNEIFHAQGFLGRRSAIPNLLVCDEGHRLLDQLTEFETVRLSSETALRAGLPVKGWPSLGAAKEWASAHVHDVHDRLKLAVSSGDRRAKHLLALERQCHSMAVVPEMFLELKTGPVVEAAPLWPKSSASRLFRSAHRVLVMSATMYGGHLLADLLGQEQGSYSYYPAPSPFPPERWPVHYRPVAALSKSAPDAAWASVSEAIHSYVHQYTNVKGVIHVSAGNQVERLLSRCRACPACDSRVFRPDPRTKRAETLGRFRDSPPGSWLCHYSVGEGESFDDDLARIQLIAKVPYPDLGDKLTRLRADEPGVGKKLYAAMTLAKIGQIAGRVMRHEKDYGETVILDANFEKLWRYNQTLAPAWLHQILRR